MAAINEDAIKGVVGILQHAVAALAQLQASQPPGGQEKGTQGNGRPTEVSTNLAGAAAALAQAAAQLGNNGGDGGGPAGEGEGATEYSGAGGDGGYGFEGFGDAFDAALGGIDSSVAPPHDEPLHNVYVSEALAGEVDTGVQDPSITDFVYKHGLETWVGEALELLTPEQRSAVMSPPMNTENARNTNGIVVSRIKQAVPLDQRLGIFVQINGLSDGVVDRISTLTPEQAESVMESGLKIQKASNPSGVAMKRISDVLRNSRTQSAVRTYHAYQSLGGDATNLRGSASARDRSRTPAPMSRYSDSRSRSYSAPDDAPPDVASFVETHGLEWWCAEVLKRLSLYQRQQITKELQNLQGVRNPSGVVMSRVRALVDTTELMSIFIDLNQLDTGSQSQLWALTSEQQSLVMSPGIYLQNVRNPSTAVRSRINNVLAGRDAFGKPLDTATLTT